MRTLPWIAVVLIATWIVLRIALAITSGLLHLLWIAALVFIAMSIFGKMRRSIGKHSH